MSTAAAHLLEAFERLSPEEQREFSAAIVQRAAQLDCGDITDEELTASAARIFAMLDEEDLAVVAERRDEPVVSHDTFIAELKRDGVL